MNEFDKKYESFCTEIDKKIDSTRQKSNELEKDVDLYRNKISKFDNVYDRYLTNVNNYIKVYDILKKDMNQLPDPNKLNNSKNINYDNIGNLISKCLYSINVISNIIKGSSSSKSLTECKKEMIESLSDLVETLSSLNSLRQLVDLDTKFLSDFQNNLKGYRGF